MWIYVCWSAPRVLVRMAMKQPALCVKMLRAFCVKQQKKKSSRIEFFFSVCYYYIFFKRRMSERRIRTLIMLMCGVCSAALKKTFYSSVGVKCGKKARKKSSSAFPCVSRTSSLSQLSSFEWKVFSPHPPRPPTFRPPTPLMRDF